MKMNIMAVLAAAAFAGFIFTPPAGCAEGKDFAAVRGDFKTHWQKFHPDIAFYLGLHLKGVAPADISGEALSYQAAYFTGVLGKIRRFEEAATKLTPEERIDLQLMRAMAGYQVHYISVWKGPLRDMQDNGNGLVPSAVMQEKVSKITGPATAVRDWTEVAEYLEGIPLYLSRHVKNLEKGLEQGLTPDTRAAEHEAEDSRSAAEFFGSKLLPAVMASFPGEVLLERLESGAQAAKEAYLDYAAFVEKEMRPAARENYAIGREEYAFRLSNMGIRQTPDEISRQGLELAKKLRAEMEDIAGKLSPVKTLTEIMAAIAADHPADDKEMFAEYTRAVGAAGEFVTSRHMFALPAGFSLPVIPTPESMRSTTPEAAYFPAPPLDPAISGVFLVTPAEGDAQTLQDQNYAAILNTAVHEAIPGHGLEYYYFQHRPEGASTLPFYNDSSVGNNGFWASALNVEGWALHAEKLMLEKGFYTTPQARLAALQALLMRAYRLPIDAGLHTGTLSFAAAAKMLAEEVFLSTGTAQGETFRYTAIPTQALTYMAGSLQIEKLKEDYRQAAGPAYDEARFYSDFAGYGPVAPEIIAPVLLDSAKKRNK